MEHMFFSCPPAQQVWHYAAKILWQLVATKTFVLGIPFQRCNVSLINLCARQWNVSVSSGSSWKTASRGLLGTNIMICFFMLCNGPLRKHIKLFGTLCMTMVGLSDNGLSQTWKRAQTSLIKMFLIKFDSMWKVKGLIVPLSNLWSRGRLGPIWTLFLDLPSLCATVVLWRWLYLVCFLLLIFNLCQKKKILLWIEFRCA